MVLVAKIHIYVRYLLGFGRNISWLASVIQSGLRGPDKWSTPVQWASEDSGEFPFPWGNSHPAGVTLLFGWFIPDDNYMDKINAYFPFLLTHFTENFFTFWFCNYSPLVLLNSRGMCTNTSLIVYETSSMECL